MPFVAFYTLMLYFGVARITSISRRGSTGRVAQLQSLKAPRRANKEVVDVVISRCKENISRILDEILVAEQAGMVYVYEKCDITPANARRIGVNYRTLPNRGREGHTYAHHILGHPHTAEYTAFLQATPYEHLFPGLSLDLYLKVNKSMPYYYPISGQLLLKNGLNLHRVRDGFKSIHPCHTGTLAKNVNWTKINRDREHELRFSQCCWGDETAFEWRGDNCASTVGFLPYGPWKCNFVPLIMEWNAMQSMSVRDSIHKTWKKIFGPAYPMPDLLHYSLGGQFTVSKDVLMSPTIRERVTVLHDLLSVSVDPIEGYHAELLWGFLLELYSVQSAPTNLFNPFSCAATKSDLFIAE
jgi:hypothetical protein